MVLLITENVFSFAIYLVIFFITLETHPLHPRRKVSQPCQVPVNKAILQRQCDVCHKQKAGEGGSLRYSLRAKQANS